MILSSRCSAYLVLLQLFPRSNTRRSPSALSGDNRHGDIRDKWSVARQIASAEATSGAALPHAFGAGVYAALRQAGFGYRQLTQAYPRLSGKAGDSSTKGLRV